MMYRLALLAVALLGTVSSAPVNPGPNVPDVKEGTDPMNEHFMSLEYKKYLEEVVQLLESDENFKAELQKMDGDKENKDALMTGQIAHYLQFANKNTRTRLDELKRLEVRRLRDLHKKLKAEAANQIRAGKRHPEDLPNVDTAHVDHDNPHTFEIEDLKKLIKKTTDDLSSVDKQRRGEFKKYEMNKEHEYKEKLKHADKEAAEKIKQAHDEAMKRHKEHPKMHHPAHKDQLEEVWEEEDHMNADSFDPKAFFMLHDIDGDGYLNTPEIEALFQKELDKVYNSSDPDDDMVERDEEMNRMREHVFGEIDTDKDMLISLDEFLKSTQTKEFDEDEPWGGLSEEDEYDSSEFDEYEKVLAEEEAKLRSKHEGNPPDVHGTGMQHDAQNQNDIPPQAPAEHANPEAIPNQMGGAQPPAPSHPEEPQVNPSPNEPAVAEESAHIGNQ